MNLYRHFGLLRSPFEAVPDPRVYFAATSHNEVTATLEFALLARKSCTVVVGESGTGKSLLARRIAASASAEMAVLWVHGLGQPDDATEIQVFAPGALVPAQPIGLPAAVPLATWLRDPAHAVQPPYLVVDNADELPAHGWRDLLALLARDVLFCEPVRLALFGGPSLLKSLAQLELARLRRRIFRTCVLKPLSRSETSDYVRTRLALAGGSPAAVFAPNSLMHLHRLTGGNPGLVNQVCDNALLEAFSAGHSRVEPIDVVAAAKALIGAQDMPLVAAPSGISDVSANKALPRPAPSPAPARPASAGTPPEVAAARAARTTTTVTAVAQVTAAAPRSIPGPGPAQPKPQPARPVQAAPRAAPVAPTTVTSQRDVALHSLWNCEAQLDDALTVLRSRGQATRGQAVLST